MGKKGSRYSIEERLFYIGLVNQGSSYTSGLFNDHLASKRIKHSMSRPGTPGDNSPMESFWGHMKTEFLTFTTH